MLLTTAALQQDPLHTSQGAVQPGQGSYPGQGPVAKGKSSEAQGCLAHS